MFNLSLTQPYPLESSLAIKHLLRINCRLWMFAQCNHAKVDPRPVFLLKPPPSSCRLTLTIGEYNSVVGTRVAPTVQQLRADVFPAWPLGSL